MMMLITSDDTDDANEKDDTSTGIRETKKTSKWWDREKAMTVISRMIVDDLRPRY